MLKFFNGLSSFYCLQQEVEEEGYDSFGSWGGSTDFITTFPTEHSIFLFAKSGSGRFEAHLEVQILDGPTFGVCGGILDLLPFQEHFGF